MLDILIKNGLVCDGTGNETYNANIGIVDKKISYIGSEYKEAGIVIDAKGSIVSPGFIDIHSHSDYYLLINPKAESKIRQGVTTEIGGNCGYSPAPLYGKIHEERKKFYHDEFGIDLDYNDFKGYFEKLKRGKTSVNFAGQIGHNTIRSSVFGVKNRSPDDEEMNRMLNYIEESFDHGVVGMSLGLIYPPSCYANLDELVECCKRAARCGGILSTHIRSEGKNLIDAIKEVLTVSEKSGIPLQISHLKTSGRKNWEKLDTVFELIESSISKGMDVTCDRYPYIASNTGLISALPEWVYEGGKDEVLKRLKNFETRKKIMEELKEPYPKEEDWDRVMVSQVVSDKNKIYEGKKVFEASKLSGKSCADFVFDLLIEEETNIEAIYFSMSDKNLDRILKKPYVMIGSDSGARADYGKLAIGKPHPRTFGSFTKVLKLYCREKGLFPIEEAVYKMTGFPAKKFKLKGRGTIKAGNFADIVIFNLEDITDTSTYSDPFNYPDGIKYVLVNGEITLKDGEHTGKCTGMVIKGN